MFKRFGIFLCIFMYGISAALGGGNLLLTGVGNSGYIPASITYTDSVSVNATCTTCSQSSLSIGAADSGRDVFVFVHHYSGTALRTISSATIGGIAATVTSAEVGNANRLGLGIIYARVPTGTTATVAVTFSGSVSVYAYGIYRVTGLLSGTPIATASGQGDPQTLNVATSADGFVLAGDMNGNNGVTNVWTGATENYDFAPAYVGSASGASVANTLAGTTNLSVNPSQSGNLALSASFR